MSEELDKAALEFQNDHDNMFTSYTSLMLANEAFKAGAKWERQRIIKACDLQDKLIGILLSGQSEEVIRYNGGVIDGINWLRERVLGDET